MNGAATSLLTTLVLSFLQQGLAINCYICSWSPEDANNRSDTCSRENFDSTSVYVHDCPLGCESFIQWDINGALEQIRRNCVQSEVDGEECTTEKIKGWERIRCTCATDYCNSGTSWTLSTSVVIAAGVGLLALV